MRIRHITNSENLIKDSKLYIDHTLYNQNNPINISNIFNNDNKIHLELGMGKGKFIINNALIHKDINYIGIEKSSTVVLHAYKTFDLYNNDIQNLKMMCFDIKDILNYFKSNCIDKIYLNFSDPWPKKRHENRRLTSPTFLDIYKKLLKKDSNIELKTDSLSLFEYSLETFANNGYNILYKTYDLHSESDDILKHNIMTEYETKCVNKNKKIHKLIALPLTINT